MANAQNIKDIAEFSISDSSSYHIVKVISGLNSCNKKLQDKYIELIDKARHLQIKNANKDIFLAKSKAENVTKSKKIRSLESMIKILEDKLSSAWKDVILIQNNSLKKEARSNLFYKSENLSLKSKIAELENIKSELESKVNQLECLKSETISKPVIGSNNEKNILNSSRGNSI